jgi:hypothetical protein
MLVSGNLMVRIERPLADSSETGYLDREPISKSADDLLPSSSELPIAPMPYFVVLS